jgi:hypothetical protein
MISGMMCTIKPFPTKIKGVQICTSSYLPLKCSHDNLPEAILAE